MALLMPGMIATAPQDSAVLDIAPAGGLSQLLRALSSRPYVSIDLDPRSDGRHIEVRADVARMPLRAGSVGFLLCSHVLEHISDDRTAVAELIRVLDPDGAVLIQVPRRRGAPTDEIPDLTPAERLERYGQSDHVRLYGDDFEDRLRGAGLNVASSSYRRLLPALLLEKIGVGSDHELWVASLNDDPERHFDPDSVAAELDASLASPAPIEPIVPDWPPATSAGIVPRIRRMLSRQG
jgi:SAM-dependent methyltransferase